MKDLSTSRRILAISSLAESGFAPVRQSTDERPVLYTLKNLITSSTKLGVDVDKQIKHVKMCNLAPQTTFAPILLLVHYTA